MPSAVRWISWRRRFFLLIAIDVVAIQKVFADGNEIFEIEHDGSRLVSVRPIGTINSVVRQPITFVTTRGPVMQLTGIPFTLAGDVPQLATIQLDIAVGALPTQSFDLTIDVTVFDADHPLEAELHVNGKFIDHLWAFGNTRANGKDSVQRIEIPGRFLAEGINTLEFVLIKSGAGFTVREAPLPVIAFVTSATNPAVSPLFAQAADAFDRLSKEL